MAVSSSVTFADLLRSYRTNAGLTQEELAAKAHLSVDAISTLERGARQRPRTDTVALLAAALALSPDDSAALAAAARRFTPKAAMQDTSAATVGANSQPQDDPVTAAPKRSLRAQDARNWLIYSGSLLFSPLLLFLVLVSLVIGDPWHDNWGSLFGDAPGNATHPPAAVERQQVLQVGVMSLTTLDPQLISNFYDYETTQLIFPSLVQFDDHLHIENWAAAQIAISTDGRTYTFALRPDLTWSNGEPITADDFAFAINRALNPCTQAPTASFLFPIADAAEFHGEACVNGVPSGTLDTLIGRSLQAYDKHTLVIHLHDPAAYFLEALSFPTSWAVPQALISRYGLQWTDHLVDAGGLGGDLFTVADWQVGKHLVLRRNTRFWGTRANLREITFVATADPKQMYTAYVAGQGDVSLVDPEQAASAQQRADYHSFDTLQMLRLGLNWSKPPFNDERMRQAFALALNKVQLDEDSFADAVVPSNHLVPQGMPGYFAALTEPDNTQNLTGNLVRAKALAQAYANDQCRGDFRSCPPVRFGVLDIIPNATTFASEAQDMWLQAMPGYPITFSVETQDDWLQEVSADKLDLWTFFYAADYPDPQDWLSNLLLPDSPFDFGHVNLAAANTLMRQADGDQNPARRQSEYNQAEQLLVNEVASIPLFQMRNIFVARPYITNYQVTALGTPSSNTWQRVYIAQH